MEKNEVKMHNMRREGAKTKKSSFKYVKKNSNKYSLWKLILIIIVFVLGPIALIWKFLFTEKLSPQELRKLKKKQSLEKKKK